VSQLRQENQELKHQIRQFSSRSKLSSSPSSTVNGEGKEANCNGHNIELFSQNQKLKKQINELKRQLNDLSLTMEKAKVDSAKEVAKWQQKIGSSSNSRSSSPAAATLSPLSAISMEERSNSHIPDAQLIVALKKRLMLLERELKIERLNKGIPSNSRASSNGKNRPSSSSVTSSVPAPRASSNRRASSVSASTRETLQRTKSASPSLFDRGTMASSHKRSVNDNARPPLPSNLSRDRRYASPKTRSLDEMDNRSSSTQRSNSNGSASSVRNRSQMIPPSASTGKRFDPTAYHQTKQKKFFDNSSSHRQSVSPLSQTSNKRFGSPSETGYTSSNSQVAFLFLR
jgi:hypothetical protein